MAAIIRQGSQIDKIAIEQTQQIPDKVTLVKHHSLLWQTCHHKHGHG